LYDNLGLEELENEELENKPEDKPAEPEEKPAEPEEKPAEPEDKPAESVPIEIVMMEYEGSDSDFDHM